MAIIGTDQRGQGGMRSDMTADRRTGRAPRRQATGVGVYDGKGGLVRQGINIPGATNKYPALVGDVRDTRDSGGRYVGIPSGSSLVINTPQGPVTSTYFSEDNTYEMLDKLMSGTANAGGKMRSPRANLMNLQRALIAYGELEPSTIKGNSDWGNPAHEATREALAKLMELGNFQGESWKSILAGGGLTNGQRDMLFGEMASGGSGGSGGGGGGAAGGTATSTRTSVQLSNRQDARAILYATMQQYLGRAPTKSEVGDFVRALNREERDNPMVSTVTDTQTPNGTNGMDSSSSQVDEGGINREVYAEQYVRSRFDDEADVFAGDNVEQMILAAIGG